MSQLEVELAKLAAILPPEIRDNITSLNQVPRELLQRFVPDFIGSQQDSQRPKRKSEDYEALYKVTTAILTKDYKELVDRVGILQECVPAKILNVIASVKLADHFDLDSIAGSAWNIEYNKKNFSGLVIQVNNPKATGVVYSTGRLMITNSRSETECKLAAEKCMDTLRKAGCHINSGESYRVQSICATTHLGSKVRIHEMGANKAIKDWGTVVTFFPEMFVGLVCQFENPKVTVVCFATGTLLFAGAHMEEDVQIALERFRVLSFPYLYY